MTPWESWQRPERVLAAAEGGPGRRSPPNAAVGAVAYISCPPPGSTQVSARFKKTPPATLRGRADAGVELLRAEVGAALASFAEELKQKSI